MKNRLGISILMLCVASATARADERSQALLKAMEAEVGTMADLHQLRDVEYTYTYRRGSDRKMDMSVERYRFDGELSYGRYVVHEVFVAPGAEGEVVQAYDGEELRVVHAGKPVTDPKRIGLAQFMRPTNFYWFAMMQKLRDPGTQHTYKGAREVNGVKYEVVEMTFAADVGENTDTYVLYFNPTTKLVDRFLFTVVAFGITEPNMMEVRYEDFGPVKLPTYRRYAPATWEGEIKKQDWAEEIMTGLHFDNGFTQADFRP